MLKFLLTFGAGVYTGLYVSQNYEVPRVDDPKKLMERLNEKISELIDGKKKTPVDQIVHDIKKEAKKIMDD
ncbi:short transmembrane mitochondrial protein 1 isoform X2 [Drosophila grimshawi]|uniref:GH16772 n=1 Tax=Drosophila grimshawi TaxID=7222 RepID=B4J3R4_DROGR|nr:short transmembrane mitochondrial protein 1 isoform X2 [Drosophila grimshawi]EDV97295.1 GH16772 [Drosophila grimshawi]